MATEVRSRATTGSPGSSSTSRRDGARTSWTRLQELVTALEKMTSNSGEHEP